MEASIVSAYVWAFVIMVVSLLIAIVASNMILYKPNNPGTTARRVWFWGMCAFCLLLGFVVNFSIAQQIYAPDDYRKYLTNSGIAAGVSTLVYILIGFIISKSLPKSKLGTWF